RNVFSRQPRAAADRAAHGSDLRASAGGRAFKRQARGRADDAVRSHPAAPVVELRSECDDWTGHVVAGWRDCGIYAAHFELSGRRSLWREPALSAIDRGGTVVARA